MNNGLNIANELNNNSQCELLIRLRNDTINEINQLNSEINKLQNNIQQYQNMNGKINEAISKLSSSKQHIASANSELNINYKSKVKHSDVTQIANIAGELESVIGQLNNVL